MKQKTRTWPRSSYDTVAVNPERITTLMALVSNFYESRCARCTERISESYRHGVVHHRHYRTLGYEKPGEDIVLLCLDCHEDLHMRADEKRLNKTDIPFVDPRWEKWLCKIQAPRSFDEIADERLEIGFPMPGDFRRGRHDYQVTFHYDESLRDEGLVFIDAEFERRPLPAGPRTVTVTYPSEQIARSQVAGDYGPGIVIDSVEVLD